MKSKRLGCLFAGLLAVIIVSTPLEARDRRHKVGKNAWIIAGSTAAGAAIGGVLGGGRGALAGALVGGGGAAIYHGAQNRRGFRSGAEKLAIVGGSSGAGAAAGGIAGGAKGAVIGGAIGAAGGYILHKKTEHRRRW